MKTLEGKTLVGTQHPMDVHGFKSHENAKLHLLQVQFHGRKLEACGAKGTPKPARPNLPDHGGVGPASFTGGLQKIKGVNQMSDRVRSAMTRRTPTVTLMESDGSTRNQPRALTAPRRSPRSGFPKYSGFDSEVEADVVEEWKVGMIDPQSSVPDSSDRQVYEGIDPPPISLPGPGKPVIGKRSERSSRLTQKNFVEADLPRPPSLPNNLPSHSTKFPFGAASHGFYARRYLEECDDMAMKHGGTASERRKRAQSARPSTPSFRALSAQVRAGRNEHETLPSTEDWQSKSKSVPFMHSDVVFMQELLGKLTDVDCEEPEILKCLDQLIGLVNGSSAAGAAIHDQGGVNIVLNLMGRLPSAQKVQIRACSLLGSAVRLNGDLVGNSIARQGGVEKILNVVELLSSSVSRWPLTSPSSDSLLKSTRPTARSASSIFGSDAGEEYLDVTDGDLSLSYTNVLAVKEGGGHRRKKVVPKRSSPTLTPAVETTLLSGLIDQYLDPSFLDSLERMKRDQRTERMSQLIGVFSKVCRLLTASSYISVETDLEMAMSRMVQDAKSMIQCELLQLYLVEEETHELIAKEYNTNVDAHDREYLPVVRFPPGRGIAGWVAEHDEPMNVPNAMENDKFDLEVDTRDSAIRRPAAILCIPVRTKDGEIKGVLEAINKISSSQSSSQNPAVFDNQDEILLRALGAQAGAIIQNSQTYETIMRTQKKVEVLLATTRSLSSTLELDQLTQTIMNSARELLSADRCTMFLVNHEQKQIHTRIRGRDGMQEVRLDMSVGIAGYVAASGEAVNIKDAYKDSRFNPDIDRQTGYVTKGILCMPIKNTRGKIVGVTQMINSANGFFSLEDEQLLSAFSAQAAIAIEQSYLFKKTEEMRVHLQSIVSSITNCVITLSDNLMVTTVNHPWFAEAVGATSDVIFGKPLDQWIGERNLLLLQDVRSVYQSSQPVFSAEYELSGPNESTFVNYNIVPLVGDSSRGVVIVLEDISAEKRAMMTLGRYMSPALAKQVMEEGGGELGGTRKRVSILFSDIRSFTTLTESMEPQDVVELLNHHFSDAVDAILAESGILDKYIGDAVMAVFGIPFVSADDAIHACNTALRMRDALMATNEERQKKGLDVLKIGIGINTGESLVGNIGNKQRMEYTVIGDSCNLASRAEGLTKYFGVQTVITEYTLQDTGDAFVTREIDKVIVVGRSTGVRMYELLGRKTDVIDPKILLVSDAYTKGLSLYRKRNFGEAIQVFEENWLKFGDRPSEVLLERCKTYVANPPPDNWDAVHRADHK